MMLLKFLAAVAVASTTFASAATGPSDVEPLDPDTDLDMTQIIQSKGYTVESHYVTTADGYILNMFRIPCAPAAEADCTPGSPVLLQHGLLDSSFTWVNNFEHQSLGFILSNQGFDVWFGNNRGNRYSRNHTSIDPDDGTSAFWDFSWDEMALFDLPAMINYVLDETKHPSLGWVGHSEGTIQMFAAATTDTSSSSSSSPSNSSSSCFTALSARFAATASQAHATRLEADAERVCEGMRRALKCVNLFVALAPVAYVFNTGSRVLTALAETNLADDVYNAGYYEFLHYGKIDEVGAQICRAVEDACDVFIMGLCGPTRNVNTTRMQVYISGTPAGTSTRNMQHWVQGFNVDTFQAYDFGANSTENWEHYGAPEAPLYDLAKLQVPTALIYGAHDYLGDPTDVQRILQEAAPSERVVFSKELPNFAHLDFVWAENAYKLVYPDVVALLSKYAHRHL